MNCYNYVLLSMIIIQRSCFIILFYFSSLQAYRVILGSNDLDRKMSHQVENEEEMVLDNFNDGCEESEYESDPLDSDDDEEKYF